MWKEQLQRSHGRLAERQCRRALAPRRQALCDDDPDGAALVERGGGKLRRRDDIDAVEQPVRRGELKVAVLAGLPEQADRGTDDRRRDAHELVRRVRLVEGGGQCLPRELEGGPLECRSGSIGARRERPQRQSRVGGRELDPEAPGGVNAPPARYQLEQCGRAAGFTGTKQDGPRACAGRGTANRGRRVVERFE